MKVLELNSYDFFSTGNIMLQIADAARKRKSASIQDN